jgi:hypothetical protein
MDLRGRKWRELHNLYASPNIIKSDEVKYEIGLACSMYARDEKCVQYFGQRFRNELTTRKS